MKNQLFNEVIKIKKKKHAISDMKAGLEVLYNPDKAFEGLWKKQFEVVLDIYLRLLVKLSILTGIVILLIDVVRSAYYTLFNVANVDMWRMLNYSFGTATGMAFFYIFAGTFGFFFLSLIIKIFVKKIKYLDLFRLMFYSAMPFLLFGWIPLPMAALLIWCVFLFVKGVKSYNSYNRKSIKNTIMQRE